MYFRILEPRENAMSVAIRLYTDLREKATLTK